MVSSGSHARTHARGMCRNTLRMYKHALGKYKHAQGMYKHATGKYKNTLGLQFYVCTH